MAKKKTPEDTPTIVGERQYPFRLRSGSSFDECVAFLREHANNAFMAEWKAANPNMTFTPHDSTNVTDNSKADN